MRSITVTSVPPLALHSYTSVMPFGCRPLLCDPAGYNNQHRSTLKHFLLRQVQAILTGLIYVHRLTDSPRLEMAHTLVPTVLTQPSMFEIYYMHSIHTSVLHSAPVPQYLMQLRVCCEQSAGWSALGDNLYTREEDRDNEIVHRLCTYR